MRRHLPIAPLEIRASLTGLLSGSRFLSAFKMPLDALQKIQGRRKPIRLCRRAATAVQSGAAAAKSKPFAILSFPERLRIPNLCGLQGRQGGEKRAWRRPLSGAHIACVRFCGHTRALKTGLEASRRSSLCPSLLSRVFFSGQCACQFYFTKMSRTYP